MIIYKLTFLIAFMATGCVNNESDQQSPAPGQIGQNAEERPGQNPQSSDTSHSDLKSISMNISSASLAQTELNIANLQYEMAFVDASGVKLVEVPRTKLPFDAATSTATISMKVKIGSKGKVVMSVGDGEAKYAGESSEITIQSDTKTNVKLKKVGGDNGQGNGNGAGGNNGADDDSANIGITATIGGSDASSGADSTSGVNPDGRNSDITSNTDNTSDSSSGSDSDVNSGTSGAVEYKTFAGTYDEAQFLTWKRSFEKEMTTEEKSFHKYIYIDEELLKDSAKANKARVGLFKALNHVAVKQNEVKLGKDISDGHGAMWVIDIREFFGPGDERATKKWKIISNADGRAVSGMISAPQLGRLKSFKYSNLEAASRVTYNVMAPTVYVQLLDTPAYERNLQTELGFKARTCEAMTAQEEAIVDGSRVSCMRTTKDGRKYWTTSDDFYGRNGNRVPYDRDGGRVTPNFRGNGQLSRPDAGTIVSESWVEMENGFNAYYIWGNADQRRGRAELFVEDPDNVRASFNFHYLETGRSCVTCHAQGVQAAPSHMAKLIREGKFTGTTLTEAKKWWTSDEDLKKLYEGTRVRFLAAMSRIVGAVSDGDQSENNKLLNGVGLEPVLSLVQIVDRTRRGR
jgi:hypothetical protein